MDLSAMRAEYTRSGLDEATAGSDPLPLFSTWLEDAVSSGLHEPNAMALATATPDGTPSVRIVLLKQLDERGAVFHTRYTSRKGTEIEANPRVAAVMPWHPLQRQVRLEGTVSRLPAQESDAYFLTRPRGGQVGAIASPQSEVIEDRAELESLVAQESARVGDGDVARPESWGGYRLKIDSFEFWQGRENRLHDRIRFRRDGAAWLRERLAP